MPFPIEGWAGGVSTGVKTESAVKPSSILGSELSNRPFDCLVPPLSAAELCQVSSHPCKSNGL